MVQNFGRVVIYEQLKKGCKYAHRTSRSKFYPRTQIIVKKYIIKNKKSAWIVSMHVVGQFNLVKIYFLFLGDEHPHYKHKPETMSL